MLTISKLRSLENERFYSILDVALDVRGELDFGAQDIVIPSMRHLVRYSILLPAATPSMMNRYCDLRWKAAKFLETEGYLANVEHLDTYMELTSWEGSLTIDVPGAVKFYEMVVMLSEEEERREPGNSTAEDMPSAMARMEQLCNSFHAVALRLQKRHAQRPPFEVANEYDVQDLLGALLETQFSEIRPEEWVGSHAGKSARMDFLLKRSPWWSKPR